ncbi:hypothetical protein CC1G_06704 [Coprinopsis cinerea okayama7|uniref:Uncharacterized protein n=1 Tax=Coprinopsis cinerea (strain Okayama-7 / 130 / ATCC MYA-4618 / FGSC 9003) TaxID=240176 RepID=A8P833_COPC7|nr:hypothetical protein CC1G_06704 [Coprinopsis cinerea okayama7\|eukprot:XP_001839491.2 hypothetical protein CC1G_06704 [Coprinopsis cinerea okayama7\
MQKPSLNMNRCVSIWQDWLASATSTWLRPVHCDVNPRKTVSLFFRINCDDQKEFMDHIDATADWKKLEDALADRVRLPRLRVVNLNIRGNVVRGRNVPDIELFRQHVKERLLSSLDVETTIRVESVIDGR